jgi:predicted component of type VI protein secretion system
LVIGRSPECDLAARDIMLSRRHCRIEPHHCGVGWKVTDLNSKNGTLLNGLPLSGTRPLNTGDAVRLGKVRILFFDGSLAAAGMEEVRSTPLRPADPTEAMSATFAGYQYLEAGESPKHAIGPSPRPRPKLPAAFDREDIHTLLNAIASSSWDSIYAEARRPVPSRGLPKAIPGDRLSRRPRPRSPIDLSLQASTIVSVEKPVTSAPRPAPSSHRAPAQHRAPTTRRKSRISRLFLSTAAFCLVIVSGGAAPRGAETTVAPTPAVELGKDLINQAADFWPGIRDATLSALPLIL